MPNPTVPAAATGLPNLPRPPVRFRMADDFTGPAGELIALAMAAHDAQSRLDAARDAHHALQQGGVRRG
jgi:hypothetical protein